MHRAIAQFPAKPVLSPDTSSSVEDTGESPLLQSLPDTSQLTAKSTQSTLSDTDFPTRKPTANGCACPASELLLQISSRIRSANEFYRALLARICTATRNLANPQGSHELEARQSVQILRVPFPKAAGDPFARVDSSSYKLKLHP